MSLKPSRFGKCKICRNRFEKRSAWQKVCGPDCAEKMAQSARIKAERRDLRVRKEALKTRSDWLREAQAAFNAWVRERDRQAGRVCVCCGLELDWTGNNVDAGHYRSVGSAPHMRFTENNVWAQRKQCNRYGAGRAVDYRIGLIARIGLEAVEALEADQTSRKWTIEDAKSIKMEYTRKLRDLRKNNPCAEE